MLYLHDICVQRQFSNKSVMLRQVVAVGNDISTCKCITKTTCPLFSCYLVVDATAVHIRNNCNSACVCACVHTTFGLKEFWCIVNCAAPLVVDSASEVHLRPFNCVEKSVWAAYRSCILVGNSRFSVHFKK